MNSHRHRPSPLVRHCIRTRVPPPADTKPNPNPQPQPLNPLPYTPPGPKIANLVMSVGLDIPCAGLVVDTHVHRLSQRLGWSGSRAGKALGVDGVRGGHGGRHAEETRRELEEWVPMDARVEVTLALISFGQTVCTKDRPLCGQCPV
jgi:endonuclease-3